MIFAVDERHLEINDREPGNHAGAQNALKPLLHTGDELFRDRAANDLVLELERRSGRSRFGNDLDLRELAGAAGLLLVGVTVLDTLGDLFAERDLWRADIGVDLVGALEDVDLDVEMQLAHALENRLAALLIGRDAERRVLGRQFGERNAEFFLVGL